MTRKREGSVREERDEAVLHCVPEILITGRAEETKSPHRPPSASLSHRTGCSLHHHHCSCYDYYPYSISSWLLILFITCAGVGATRSPLVDVLNPKLKKKTKEKRGKKDERQVTLQLHLAWYYPSLSLSFKSDQHTPTHIDTCVK